MATQTLPGVRILDQAKYALTFAGPTFDELLTSTVPDTEGPAPSLAASAGDLDALMTAFEAEFNAAWPSNPIPDSTGPPLDLGPLIALEVEASIASATELAIGSAFDFLGSTFGVWGVFNVLVQDIITALYNLYNDVLSLFYALNNQLNFINPGTFGGGL